VKIRLRATKLGKVRFTSHRDAARMWERAMRRVGLPVAITEGFTPRPRISFGLALPTGAESIAEYVDVDLQCDLLAADLGALPAQLTQALPVGFDVLVAAICDRADGSLQETVTSCTWELWSPVLRPEHHQQACRLLESSTLVIDRERKGKRSTDEVRAQILDLRTPNETNGDRLVAELATDGRALRPGELARLAYPHLDPVDVRILRTHQWISRDGQRRDVVAWERPIDWVLAADSLPGWALSAALTAARRETGSVDPFRVEAEVGEVTGTSPDEALV
jgi:radical SAM-linked protein